jgi:hypothetical protein
MSKLIIPTTASTKAERRRIRRGRQTSAQRGQGHGETTYIPVQRTNRLATEGARETRRLQLAQRDERTRAYVDQLRKRVAKESQR